MVLPQLPDVNVNCPLSAAAAGCPEKILSVSDVNVNIVDCRAAAEAVPVAQKNLSC